MSGIGTLFTILGSMFGAFLIGFLGALLIGNRFVWNYIKVKMSRNTKVLLFVKTPFGWESTTAKKEDNTLLWNWDTTKNIKTTILNDTDIVKYNAVSCAFVEREKFTGTINVKDGVVIPQDFDLKTYQNILLRAQTAPPLTEETTIKRMVLALIFISVVSIIIGLLIYAKQGQIAKEVLKCGAQAITGVVI
jgi:hypothetical protein